MLHAASATAPAACSALRLPLPDDLAERLAIVAEDPAADSAFLRAAVLRTYGFADDRAYTDAHRRRLCDALGARIGRTPVELRLLLMANAFITSPWYLEAVRYGWADGELFGWAGPTAETSIETAGLVVALALCCPKGARLMALDDSTATLAVPDRGEGPQRVLYRFWRTVLPPFYEQLPMRDGSGPAQRGAAHV